MNLLYFEKPTRYINQEVNSVIKSNKDLIKFALCFPDIYEIGMSHLGLKILYHILNSFPYVYAERVFSPWIDLEEYMRKYNIPLTSLETKTPLNKFDIVGFSLQYELSYPTVLNMLDLGQIPLKWQERLNLQYPLIIAGGPCTVNPLPMADFIDVFLIGEGEEAVIEIVKIYKELRELGESKEELLKAISQLKGFYVPFIGKKPVKRRFVRELETASFPIAPVVPYAKIVHDRISIEVSRGCPSGCRFCQSGMIYRPLRYRSPEKVFEIARSSFKNTGYEEVSLLSFSIGHYPYLLELIDILNKYFEGKGVAISIPSIRADKVTRELLQKIKFVRKTGFTIAPEAGSERLRKVINKNITDEEIERVCSLLFEEGWHSIKLYFMIGLPTETEGDIEEIINLTRKIIKIAKLCTKKYVNINVTISPFIPKPHTPFQWLGQIDFDEMVEKLEFIRNFFQKSRIHYKGHNPKMSLLEAVLSRGDEKVGEVIYKAWLKGERLSAWSDLFNFNRWLNAMDETGVNLFAYANRTYLIDDELPWNFIDTGINLDFLKDEFKRALTLEQTQDCTIKCEGCGLRCKMGEEKEGKYQILSVLKTFENVRVSDKITAVRFCHSKMGMMKYLSQLEMGNLLIRALRMAEIPFVLSKGFHPKPEISFCPSLPVGVESEEEYFDLKIYGELKQDDIERLNKILPEGLKILRAKTIEPGTSSLNSFIQRYKYIVKLKDKIKIDKDSIQNIQIQRNEKNILLKEFLEDIQIYDNEACIIIKDGILKARISEIVEVLFGGSIKDLEIKRIEMYGFKGGWIKP